MNRMQSLAVAALASMWAPLGPASAQHEHMHHATPMTEVVSGEEILRLPDLPVRDKDGVEGGFRSRLPGDRPLILAFTYMSCTTICPGVHAVLMVVDDELGAGEAREATLVTVAIDPVGDTPERLAETARTFGAGPDWLWLTGGPRGTRPLLQALNFHPGPLEDHVETYLVGQPCTGRYTRLRGAVTPDDLVALVRAQPRCD
ncbi:SCO family protein [Acuticoccus sediminis]|uniref:SCO family protein n=1 Tax=Acuticoccus sediminis TaxID=2184697 RepID=UPI001CFCA659|nr:SCO family protein [Acuticoccus sediminis]